MTTPYSQAFAPPAPVLEIRIAAPGGAHLAGPFTALLDTGADASLAPRSVLLALGAPSLFEAQLRSPWGEPHAVVVYLVDLLIGTERLPAVEFAADESDGELLLGRNVLNKLPFVLDGPALITQLVSEPNLQRLRSARTSG